jgi:hypothetical protein
LWRIISTRQRGIALKQLPNKVGQRHEHDGDDNRTHRVKYKPLMPGIKYRRACGGTTRHGQAAPGALFYPLRRNNSRRDSRALPDLLNILPRLADKPSRAQWEMQLS